MAELFPPREGFSKGTIQGLCVGLPLLLLLVGLAVFAPIQPRGALAIALDFVAAISAAVIGVWAVGGLFELNGRIFDIGVKAAGGIAIMLFIAVWLRPFYNSGSFAPNAVSVTIPAGEGLDFVLDVVDRDIRENKTTVRVDYSGQRVDIGRLRPVNSSEAVAYAGSSWYDVMKKVAADAPCLTVTGSNDAFVIKLKDDSTSPGTSGDFLICR